MTGRVSFVGAGPGAADLITVRGAKRIAEADVVLWSPGVVEVECVREHARPDAELVDFSRVTESDVAEVYRRASAGKLKVVRLHAGDPALWGGLRDQQDACRRLGLETDVVPGVSQISAAAASVGRELTTSDIAQSLLLAGPESAEHIREFAAHGTTMAISASGARTGLLVERLRAGGYADDTPVVVAYKVSLPDETVAQTTLGELEACVKEHKLYRTTLFLVGKVLAQSAPRRRSAVVEGDEPVRRLRPSKWSKRIRPVADVPPLLEVQPSPENPPLPAVQPSAENRPDPESPSAAAWSAVHDWQETARTKRSGQSKAKPEPVREPVLELVVDLPEPAEPSDNAGTGPAGTDPVSGGPAAPEAKPKPKPVVAAAAKPTPPTVRASTTPRKPTGSRTKKNRRAN
ncbi:cobalt-precorrin-4/precorrin-4 C(11)-methyltransferase [Saccharothrix sp. NRRL B-16314]|uniref:cobalt-precorrin-4/precorrin-4 C(11)-methyltransferase n=1 Tax=Saccharothrix sp. NRRL B-16314 TaxID=1463825 RepID=UPI000526FC7B|nr:cobalt-precorrin-4/precorrin-4 C(11)-methyltransferase [Saccharothrix sp. NRRL B-16314]